VCDRVRRNRRLAILPAAVAAIVPGVALLTTRPGSPVSDGVAGLIVGVLLGVSIAGPAITLLIREAFSVRAALPDDVASVAVYQWIGDDFPLEYERWTLAAQVARARLKLSLTAPPGTPVRFVARYLNRRGDSGRWSDVTLTYAMGGMTFRRNLIAA
jgi:hypothetical protein